jgi:hypothetical protein
MTLLAAIGIETWRNNKRTLPGAKPEISANVQEFFDDQRPLLRVIYPRVNNQATETLLKHFWLAIESVGRCQSESQSFKSIKDLNATPILILSEDLAFAIKDSGLMTAAEAEALIIGADPQTVYATPMLKANWWELIMNRLKAKNMRS